VTADSGNHSEFEALAVGWALHSLEPDDEERFAGHLPGCAECQRTVADMTATLGELASVVPEEEPPPGLRDRLLSAASETPQNVGRAPLERVPPVEPDRGTGRHAVAEMHHRRGSAVRGGRMLVAAAVALVLVVGLGVWNIVLRNDRNSATSQASRYRQAVTELTLPGARRAALDTSAGKQVATVVTRGDKAAVVSLAMPQNDVEKTTYVLWGLKSATSAPVALGTFDVPHNGVEVRSVTVDATSLGYPTYALSREPGRHAPSKPSSVMATGGVST
jgi:anti-sigma factor RsiW